MSVHRRSGERNADTILVAVRTSAILVVLVLFARPPLLGGERPSGSWRRRRSDCGSSSPLKRPRPRAMREELQTFFEKITGARCRLRDRESPRERRFWWAARDAGRVRRPLISTPGMRGLRTPHARPKADRRRRRASGTLYGVYDCWRNIWAAGGSRRRSSTSHARPAAPAGIERAQDAGV